MADFWQLVPEQKWIAWLVLASGLLNILFSTAFYQVTMRLTRRALTSKRMQTIRSTSRVQDWYVGFVEKNYNSAWVQALSVASGLIFVALGIAGLVLL